MSVTDADVIVVGSGPAGAQAAKQCIEDGVRVLTIDVGVSERSLGDSIPSEAFSTLRRTDREQRRYFVGNLSEADIADVKGAAHLTPPRAYMLARRELATVESSTFFPVSSFALGGLGVGWGAGCETFSDEECLRAGLDVGAIRRAYELVSKDIGISGARTDDISENMARLDALQPPLPIDDNAANLLARYLRNRDTFRRAGFRLGRPPIAMLSEPLESAGATRSPNPLHDMDMYSDTSRSVYRPWITIDALRQHPKYRYLDNLLALTFREEEGAVEVVCRDLRTQQNVTFRARRLILAAGAINTSRIVLRSLDAFGERVPLLCNRYRYIPSTNLGMLGRKSRDVRHSLAQLAGTLAPRENDPDQVFLGIYSYRSLLTYRLAAQMPLPTSLGLLAARILLSSLTVIGAHFADSPVPGKWLELAADGRGGDVLKAAYEPSADEVTAMANGMRSVLRVMAGLKLLPLSIVDPGNGASIHYAGPLGMRPAPSRTATAPDGTLYAAPRVHVADSSSWNFLPAKGPTLTIMAQARLVAADAVRRLGADVG